MCRGIPIPFWLPDIECVSRPWRFRALKLCANIVECRPRRPPFNEPLMLLIYIISFLVVSSLLIVVISCLRSMALLVSKDSSSSYLLASNFVMFYRPFFCSLTNPYRFDMIFFKTSTSFYLAVLLWVSNTAFRLFALRSARRDYLSFSKFLTTSPWVFSLFFSCCFSSFNCFSMFSIFLVWFWLEVVSYSFFWRYSLSLTLS